MLLSMNRRGFTIVELLIVIAVMGILLVLGVVNLRSTQVDARDKERSSDIETIATALEAYYMNGTTGSTSFGRYASTSLIGQETATLPDIDVKALKAPDQSSYSLVAATCSGTCNQTTSGMTPQPTINQYVYQPLQQNGSLCTGTQECRKFNLFYRTEVDNTVHKVTSRHQ